MGRWGWVLVGLMACGESPGPSDVASPADFGVDVGVKDGAPSDGGAQEVGAEDGGVPVDAQTNTDASEPADALPSDGDVGPAQDAGPSDAARPDGSGGDASFDAGPPPSGPITPIPGELTIIQLDLPPGVTFRLGEAAIIVGPAGALALLDVGNSNHDDELRARIAQLNQARGRPAGQVEWIILTHFHGDHVGAMEGLFSGSAPLTVTRGVVHRGFVDLGEGMNTGDYGQVCTLLRGPLAAVDRPLCTSLVNPPCTFNAGDDPAVANACPGLRSGDLEDPSDDALGLPAFFDLDGVTISLSAANGFVHDGQSITAVGGIGHVDSNEENARSLVGQVQYGHFRYHFGGDLTGSGDPGEPDVESPWANLAAPGLYGNLGVDVTHVHHHARRTSSNANLVTALCPLDGRPRNVIAGINAVYVGSPYAEVLDAFTMGGRLGTGAFWTTRVATGSANPAAYPDLVVSEGEVILQTIGGGLGYWVQAAGPSLAARAFSALR